MKVNIIGAGLAGCEAAWYLANNGVQVKLYEKRPKVKSPAHETNLFAELVCSNSLRARDITNAVGLLKVEMADLGSLVMESAKINEVPAGGAIAVDREKFSEYITKKIVNHPNIEVVYDEYKKINDKEYTIITTGPLTDGELSKNIKQYLGQDYLSFFDAAAPIVTIDSLNMDKIYLKSRYDKGEAAYLNAPMNKQQYETFYNELINAKCVELKEFELKVFEGCMPIEEMAKRGEQTMLFGPLKPVGLEMPSGKTPYAVVQLRQDNSSKTLYNIVGFQTHLTFGEQKRILSLIPGMENVEIVRYGVMHRNTFICSPKVLNNKYQTLKNEKIFFAGQITGVEGYVESAASGINAAINMLGQINDIEIKPFPKTTAFGALSAYISDKQTKDFQPMNINFGIMEPLKFKGKKKDKKEAVVKRARQQFETYIKENNLGVKND